jgi:hypothetical protein
VFSLGGSKNETAKNTKSDHYKEIVPKSLRGDAEKTDILRGLWHFTPSWYTFKTFQRIAVFCGG